MPIISDIASMGNFIINLITLMIEKPIILLIFVIMILSFPLNVIDYILTIFVNLFILIFNILIFIIIIPIKLIVFFIFWIINALILIIASPLVWLLDAIGISWSPATITLPPINPPIVSYQYIDWFGTNDTLLGYIISALGLSFPLFKIYKPILNYL